MKLKAQMAALRLKAYPNMDRSDLKHNMQIVSEYIDNFKAKTGKDHIIFQQILADAKKHLEGNDNDTKKRSN